jgi:glycolate oxidase
MLDTEQMLKEIVGPENVSSNPAILEAYRFVAMGQDLPLSSRPDIVVMPSNEEQVSRIMSLANRIRLPVATRGQGTGFQGENVALEGGILMDLSLMNRLIEIDEDNMVVIAETGCTMNLLATSSISAAWPSPSGPGSLPTCTSAPTSSTTAPATLAPPTAVSATIYGVWKSSYRMVKS